MSAASDKRAEDFLKVSSQFQLGSLLTESSHPVTANLSEVASQDISKALELLFEVDADVVRVYRAFARSGRAFEIAGRILPSLQNGGKFFFSGCGSTGRLSIQLVSIWRDFWQRQQSRGITCSPSAGEFEQRALSVMAGGDFALIKAVEGFEDFADFGKKQIADLGICSKDILFAITEGGETSFVIGTAWKALEAGAKVYFVYNNPDELLINIKRSREIIHEPRIEKINLTTGPMAITGSTRMQATSIQLCVLLTVLEVVLRELMHVLEPGGPCDLPAREVPAAFVAALERIHQSLKSKEFVEQLSHMVSLEETVYRAGQKINYYADHFGIDALTDTTERSPTYCVPPFRKFDDSTASESWAFLFLPYESTVEAWNHLLKRQPQCIKWNESEIRALTDEKNYARTCEIIQSIGSEELLRFRIGSDGMGCRRLGKQDRAIAVITSQEQASLRPGGFYHEQLDRGFKGKATVGVIAVGGKTSLDNLQKLTTSLGCEVRQVFLAVPTTDFLLDGVSRVGLKMLLNALSTCTMVRLGRVMGNYMIWVVPSNLKLIDRATRYIQKLTTLDYRQSNYLLFEVIEYIEPRMKAGQSYPPAVGMSILRARKGISNKEAENVLADERGLDTSITH